MWRLEIWADHSNWGLCARVQQILVLNPPELGVEVQAVAVTGDNKYRNFVAHVRYGEFIDNLKKQFNLVEGLWINEYPPGVEEQIKAGTIWQKSKPG